MARRTVTSETPTDRQGADDMTQITMQLNAIDHAGDWATRRAGQSRTATVATRMGRRAEDRVADEVAVRLHDLRGAVEAIKTGEHSPTLADTRTTHASLDYGTPAAYSGMWFALGA